MRIPLRTFASRLVLVPLILLLAACGRDAGNAPASGGKPDGKSPAAVVTAGVVARAFREPVSGIATLRARESVTVTAPTEGRVREILFREGSRVPVGAVLLRLEDDRERADLEAARTQSKLQEARFSRTQALRARGLVSDDERDAAEQALREAQARLEVARVAQDLRTVRAPFAGVLGFRAVSPGTLVKPGDAITSLDAIDSLRATFAVPETLLGVVAAGQSVLAHAAAWPGREFRGSVSMVGTRVDATTRTVDIEARLDNPDGALRPGMLLTVTLATRERDALFVPEAALVPENARQYAWRVSAGRDPATGVAHRVEVATGARGDGEVEVTAGLAAGDRVVVEGQGSLREGRPVKEAGATATEKAAPASAPRGTAPK